MKTREEYLNDIKQFKKEFANKFGILSIGIFGSVARNEHQAESDLDVFVELQEPDFFIMSDIKERLEQICNCKIDLLRLRKNLRPLLLKRIEQDGIYA
ncbi:MAG: nucleotidyltransferase domain-containing protein [Bacteroidaceae bacterium]|nr:nucleotidyltransferase domain-containing protein [Bacteroidaceae bacterium]